MDINEQSIEEGFLSKLASVGLAGMLATGASNSSAADTKTNKPPIVSTSSVIDLNGDIHNIIKSYENNKNYPPGGFDKESQKWMIYMDQGWPTIAYGHHLSKEDIEAKVYEGGITDEQADAILKADVEKRKKTIHSFIPKFNRYPKYIQNALILAIYRGDILPKHKTVKLINLGKFKSASVEFLNNDDYTSGNTGIKKRMLAISNAFLKYSKELAPKVKNNKPIKKGQQTVKEIDFKNNDFKPNFNADNPVYKWETVAEFGNLISVYCKAVADKNERKAAKLQEFIFKHIEKIGHLNSKYHDQIEFIKKNMLALQNVRSDQNYYCAGKNVPGEKLINNILNRIMITVDDIGNEEEVGDEEEGNY